MTTGAVAWDVVVWAVVVVEAPNENPVELVEPKEKPVDVVWVVFNEKPVDPAWVVPKDKPVDGVWVVPKEKPLEGWVVPKEKPVEACVVPNEKPVDAWVVGACEVGIADIVKPVIAEVLAAAVELPSWTLAVAEGVDVRPKFGVEPIEREGVLKPPKLNAGFAVAVAVVPKTEVLVDKEDAPNVGALVGNEKAGAKKCIKVSK